MRTDGSVIETNWLERLGWMIAAAAVSGFGAWLWASFKKVDKTVHEVDMRRIEEAINHRFQEFEFHVVEPIRKRNSQFEQKFETLNEKLDKVSETLVEIRTELKVKGK